MVPVLLPGKSHGRRSLVGCHPWGRRESDTTERLPFHFSLSCIGEGNGNPLQCSCLENPRDGGAWWAAVYGVAQSRTRLKRQQQQQQQDIYKCFHSPSGYHARASSLSLGLQINNQHYLSAYCTGYDSQFGFLKGTKSLKTPEE